MIISAGTVELRPSLRTMGRAVVAPTQLLLLALLAVNGALLAADDDAVVLWVPAAALGLAVLVVAVWRLVGRFQVTGQELRCRNLLRTRAVPRSRVAEAVLLPAFRDGAGARPSGLLVVLDDARRPLLRLDGLWWGRDRLAAIAEAVGAPVRLVPEELTPADLAWRNVYELPWRHRHPYLVQVLTTIAILVGAFAAARLGGN
ncbi:hypothetical protein SAMN04515665_11327 [Blastococcus sp. DSM 46786]|uniref:hypothetical protein n=1 Tax=Blastococcus sp. DSM 46786 TaxID=1798227 RepID=UPI0008B26A77|nr:hypothetical protein [Blastococcus sp. DSM 46786]SEL46813.1 hypothetical protein SAMN04515665_11327 [Blastococcus sp. DSM 46786]